MLSFGVICRSEYIHWDTSRAYVQAFTVYDYYRQSKVGNTVILSFFILSIWSFMQPLLMIFCSHMILWVALLNMIPICQDYNSFTRWHSFNNCKKDAWISIKLCSCDSWKQTTRDSNVSLFWIKLQFNIVQYVAEGRKEGVLSICFYYF